ncbi:AAA family ATPase [Flavobacterium sp. HSC-32F16]|uniref:AAA family ATPase n=1 Tax=Flavobacterium sp. HSC-32F16 TaxID=2910964 RepID=UPI0020A5DA0C|nr:AAA family ATPase [Flavobacterium sp. HSC-32F16]
MKIKKISLQNFRCYEDNEFEFGTNTTIIIGKNGTGKSTLLSALRKGMSFMFSSSANNIFNKNNTTKIEKFLDWDTTFKENGDGFQWPTSIDYTVSIENTDEITWKFFRESYNGKLHSKYYKDVHSFLTKHYKSKNKSWPLFSFYGDCYPHRRKEKNPNINKFNELLLSSYLLPRDIGYSFWNDDGSIATSWFKRYKFILGIIQQDEESIEDLNKEITLLEDYKRKNSNLDDTFTERLRNVKLRLEILSEKFKNTTSYLINEQNFVKEIVIEFFSSSESSLDDELILYDIKKRKTIKDELLFFSFGKANSFDEGIYNEETLPMGYQRLIHIVFDLAYRCFFLNGSNKEFSGIVLIDEIELHLHPNLQKSIMDKFMKTFPGLQFIVTTHSPIILSNLKVEKIEKKILKLDKNNGKYTEEELDNVYGLDYNSNLIDIMGVNISNQILDAYINAYNFLKNEDEKLAIEYKEKIADIYNGIIPVFIKDRMTNDKI